MAYSLTTNIQQLRILLIMLVSSSIISGCTFSRKHMNPDLAFPKEPYEIGITDREEVLAELGPPLKMTLLPEGYAFMYEGLSTKELQLGLSLPIPVIEWFKFVLAQADYNHHVLVYQFDREHKLIAAGADNTYIDLGDKMAVQPIFTVEVMFDTSAVENEVVDLTEWTEFCLQPLPQTLNRHCSLNGGLVGFESRGTAPVVGQRALEMHR
jgi:hypothetical protein